MTAMTSGARSRFVSRIALLCLPLVLVGCGGSEGTVSGRVLYAGAPLPGGLLTFRPADPRQNSVTVELDQQGNYRAVLPAGDVKVCIDNRELEPVRSLTLPALPPNLPGEVKKALGGGGRDKAPEAADDVPGRSSGRYVRIPERYHDVETSGLQFTVRSGEQKRDIELAK
jgi:hypothetical protein